MRRNAAITWLDKGMGEIVPEEMITSRVVGLASWSEVRIGYSGRMYAEGKKINWKDGLRAIWYILKYR
jgi:hypothetical protein